MKLEARHAEQIRHLATEGEYHPQDVLNAMLDYAIHKIEAGEVVIDRKNQNQTNPQP